MESISVTKIKYGRHNGLACQQMRLNGRLTSQSSPGKSPRATVSTARPPNSVDHYVNMKENDTLSDKTPAKAGRVSEIGNGPVTTKYSANVSSSMSVTDSETTVVALADVLGRDVDGDRVVPDTATATVHELTDDVLEVSRNGHTFTIEIGLGSIAEVTLVDGRRPECVPDWLAAVVSEREDVSEVTL